MLVLFKDFSSDLIHFYAWFILSFRFDPFLCMVYTSFNVVYMHVFSTEDK